MNDKLLIKLHSFYILLNTLWIFLMEFREISKTKKAIPNHDVRLLTSCIQLEIYIVLLFYQWFLFVSNDPDRDHELICHC